VDEGIVFQVTLTLQLKKRLVLYSVLCVGMKLYGFFAEVVSEEE
jgi:hypothetical protein